MSMFTKSSPSRLGHVVLTGVFIAVPLLMFLPNIVVRHQYRELVPGDLVAYSDNSEGRSDVYRVKGETSDGHLLLINQSGALHVSAGDPNLTEL